MKGINYLNPGPVEETAKAANSFFDALRSQPLSLALVVMNLALLVFFYLILKKEAEQEKHQIELIYNDKREVGEILARCVVPNNYNLIPKN